MELTKDMHVADVAAALPATIKVFQQRGLDFCCGGHRPLADACDEHGIDVDDLLAELGRSGNQPTDDLDWRRTSLADLVTFIQARFHVPLGEELPRLAAMVDKVVSRHGERHPEVLAVQREFNALRYELTTHMAKEDAVLFPAIVAIEEGRPTVGLHEPVHVMEEEHARAGAALATLRNLTSDYTPPAGACPTFQGLYYGLLQLEQDMHVHIHLENNILFPRAVALART